MIVGLWSTANCHLLGEKDRESCSPNASRLFTVSYWLLVNATILKRARHDVHVIFVGPFNYNYKVDYLSLEYKVGFFIGIQGISEFPDIVEFIDAPLNLDLSIQKFHQKTKMVEFMNSRRLFGLKF